MKHGIGVIGDKRGTRYVLVCKCDYDLEYDVNGFNDHLTAMDKKAYEAGASDKAADLMDMLTRHTQAMIMELDEGVV